MSAAVNKVIIVGNLGGDPQINTTRSGTKIANLSVATSESWPDKRTGERIERTEWHKIVILNERLVEVAERFLTKGRKVYIEGALQTRKWTDQNGTERYNIEIVLARFRGEITLLDSNPEASKTPRPQPAAQNTYSARSMSDMAPQQGTHGDDLEDDIPF